MVNWEDALMVAVTRRENRRATTDTVVRDNTAFSIRVLKDGYGAYRMTWYYRRHLAFGVYTGDRGEGIARHLQALHS